jgi:hypothetical protein
MSDEQTKNNDGAEKDGAETGAPGSDPQVPIDFTTFILSLSSSAAFHLGLAPHPENDTCCENLPMAKQTIDILAMLEEKTKGNVTGAEERLLSEVLYNLRMAYVAASEKCECSDGESK